MVCNRFSVVVAVVIDASSPILAAACGVQPFLRHRGRRRRRLPFWRRLVVRGQFIGSLHILQKFVKTILVIVIVSLSLSQSGPQHPWGPSEAVAQ